MVYKVTFEADVNGIASVKRIDGVIYVYSKDAAAARHFTEGYLKGAYSETFAIISLEPCQVLNLPGV